MPIGSVRLSVPNGISIGSSIYAQLMADSPYILQWVPFPPKLSISMGDLDQSNTLFLGLTRVAESTTKMPSGLLQPLLQSSRQSVELSSSRGAIWTPS